MVPQIPGRKSVKSSHWSPVHERRYVGASFTMKLRFYAI